ncbi:hypothetical protein HX057_01855 [Myroides odoratimimus]|uniref:Uncharacterized protein n=2 Tax=Myroides TaxID=76831 RepID=A0AAI8C2G4_9FLAO|nr:MULTISPECIES: hypothetical protein [Myroides]AJH16584.1 hypothetical protein MPR_3470 [Myroides profundi]ALU25428.1 hypothetical protein AS202_04340 [Myroides odoratimimus]APA91443.1 hypothetical protein BK054_04225 [Myroides sp. ZB35]EHO05158.1 hypothetical protein HMPREF9714_03521 [Myroides odoratimimus CCUG 12901]EKB02871.1 hypothetical protein HMPREF9711_02948 [Myroides odoratimimus CCUG 3837]
MLNKGTKSEEERRIESIVQKLSSIGFTPEDKKFIEDLDVELQKIGLSYEQLLITEGKDLALHLHKFNFPWDKMEEFTDLLVKWSSQEPSLKAKAKAVYQYIQDESKAFSFNIMTKISRL